MIVEEKIVSFDINKCSDTVPISGSVDSKEVNINVTTCFEAEEEENLAFDYDLDFTL